MKNTAVNHDVHYELSPPQAGHSTLSLHGALDAGNAAGVLEEIRARLTVEHQTSLTVDMEKVTLFDDFGALVLFELKKMLPPEAGSFQLANVPADVEEMLFLLKFHDISHRSELRKKELPGIIDRLGAVTISTISDIHYMISFTGSVFIALGHTIMKPGSLRKDDTYQAMQKTGVDALPIVALISFLLGLIMAFMSSVQLQQFGANIYVASLVSLSMTRELGPIMTAIIVAGRSGSAFAAEIGTMKVSEEVDALITMGFNPIAFLVIPKTIASVIVVPLLTMFSDVFAICGGLVVGVSMLDLTVNGYVDQTIQTLTLFDVFYGAGKSAVFALLIAWIGCLRGFQVRGGAASVGQAATSAVVSSLFLIIVADAVFAVILRYWG